MADPIQFDFKGAASQRRESIARLLEANGQDGSKALAEPAPFSLKELAHIKMLVDGLKAQGYAPHESFYRAGEEAGYLVDFMDEKEGLLLFSFERVRNAADNTQAFRTTLNGSEIKSGKSEQAWIAGVSLLNKVKFGY